METIKKISLSTVLAIVIAGVLLYCLYWNVSTLFSLRAEVVRQGAVLQQVVDVINQSIQATESTNENQP